MAKSLTIGTALIALQQLASNTLAQSSEHNVASILKVFCGIHIGRDHTNALTTAVKIRLEGSVKASGAAYWFVLKEWTGVTTAAGGTEAVNGTCSSGQNVIPMASTTGFTVRDLILIKNTTIGNSEWARIKKINANVSVELEDNLVSAQTGSTVYNGSEFFTDFVDVSGVNRIRLTIDAVDTGQTIVVDANMNTYR